MGHCSFAFSQARIIASYRVDLSVALGYAQNQEWVVGILAIVALGYPLCLLFVIGVRLSLHVS